MISSHIKIFDFIKKRERYEFKVQIFATSLLYLFLLGLSTLFVQFFITRNQEIIGNSFWTLLSISALLGAEICIRLNDYPTKLNIYTNIILTFQSIIVIPLGVYISGSITTPSIIYVFVGIALVSLLATGVIKFILNSFIIIFCLSFIYIEYYNPALLNIEAPIYSENLEDWAIVFVIILVFFNKLISSVRKLIEKNTNTINKQKNKLYNMSIKDYLTNLYNKKYLYDILNIFVNDLNEKDESFSLIALDIDYFKIFNDTYGHIEGDVCLKEIASIFTSSINKEKDYAFRFGGEEFIIALRSEEDDYGIKVVKAINNKLAKKNIENINSPISPSLTLSYGLVKFDSTNKLSLDTNKLLKDLDKALYKSKENGRNQCFSYDGNKFFKVEL